MIIDIYSIYLYYLKYKIIYSVKNISFNVIYNNHILFDDKNDNIKYEDLQKKIKIAFKNISFFRENNFLFYKDIFVDSIIVPKIEKINKFRFFKDYNEGKVEPFYQIKMNIVI